MDLKEYGIIHDEYGPYSIRRSIPPVYDQSGRQVYEEWVYDYGKHEDKLLHDPKPQFKAAVLRASPCAVSVVSLGVPPEMTRFSPTGRFNRDLTEDQVYMGSGTILECEKNAVDDKFSTTVLTGANLFIRTNGVQPSDIEVEVYLANGDKCKGKVWACDFHYNLALVNIQLDSPVQPAKLRDLDDIMSIHECHSDDSQSFELRRHSSLFKIRPGDNVAVLARFTDSEFGVSFGQFSVSYPSLDCKELYYISSEEPDFQDICGSPVINCHGEVIGILAFRRTFLPSNIISRWWKYYKNCKEYCRPWLGLNVANLQSANFCFLERFVRTFPNVSSGIIVTEVVENSAAVRSRLRREDVIVQCDGATVGSTLDFFDKIWDKIGASVELSVLRKTKRMNVKVKVDVPTPDKFYSWPVPPWRPGPGPDIPVLDPCSKRNVRRRASRS